MITEKQALELAIKILKDIKFGGDDVINPKVRLIEGSNLSKGEDPYWLVSHSYAAEDFGEDRAHVFIDINRKTGVPSKQIIVRGGSITIKYDAQNDKYSRVK